ncbi:putative receptor-like protein kinase At3g47110 [Lycium ferocissimum]|uniref:putative receptor-like protein kinase At3g47110 n=1 Tax=Lycium ferocissimum TaxID=112874 RepID=UPI00281528A8|nr:putative receptor-like protein kinase At3g47110 [Lycium ferocissimum]
MKNIPYTSVVRSLMYARVCTRPDIAFFVGILEEYQSNSVHDHSKAANKVLRYLKNNESDSRSKHIDIKYLAIREHVKDKKVVIQHVSTELSLADPLTKGMPPQKFKDHVVIMGLSSTITSPSRTRIIVKASKVISQQQQPHRELPPSFGNFSSLQELSMNYNYLEEEIPSTIALLQNLTVFRVAVNHFSSVFPPPLYNLSTLQLLSISQKKFHGDLKDDMGLIFPNIQRLYLGGNGFTGNILVLMSNAPNLVQLDLTANKFTGSIPLSFGKLMALLFLNVNSNQLRSDDLNFLTPLTNCRRLQLLDIAYNQFTGEFPCSIGNIPALLGKHPTLKELYLASNQLTSEIPSSLGNVTRLLYLSLHNNSLEGTIPSGFGNIKFLQESDLSHNSLNGTIPKHFIGLSTFSRTLNLSHNFLTGALPSEVGNIQLLAALDVSYNKLSDEIPNEIG